MKYPILYEINTRCWLGQLSRRHGFEITLATVPDSEFTRWLGLGFTHIWLMGVWRTGPRSRAEAMRFLEVERASMRSAGEMEEIGIVGSPYAVAEYSVSEALGGESGLQTFRRRLHERGLKLVLDFVPNHVGLDHGWVTERPELFVQSRAESPGFFAQQTKAGARWLAHGRDPYFPPWSDTAQLDYRRKDTREEMRSLLLEIAGRCDGVRCDMAMLSLRDVFEKTWKDFSVVPPADESSVEFWEDAVARVKAAHPEMLFLAEVY
ncbi:MAG TPA: alpha-amylase family glycosyl hydrolase, partial [Verrucomicrobiae bacterium]|nr:alpha-amylase family glycosyl hydrolase [Verrucomicrobiae bacterium]